MQAERQRAWADYFAAHAAGGEGEATGGGVAEEAEAAKETGGELVDSPG